MMINLREIEARALAAQRSGDFTAAKEAWLEILAEQPNWEGGYAYYYLADCYTRAGQISLAEDAYRKAIAIAPEDAMFSEALESLIAARKAGHI